MQDKQLPSMIKEIMENMQLNQSQLAKEIGVNQSTICKAIKRPDNIRYRIGKSIERLHAKAVAEGTDA